MLVCMPTSELERKETFDGDQPKSTRFPGRPLGSRRSTTLDAAGARRRGRRRRPRSGLARRPRFAWLRLTSPTISAGRRIHRCPLPRGGGGPSAAEMVGRGEIDIHASFAGTVVYQLDKGLPLTALAGVNVGCYELFATSPRDDPRPKGRRVGSRPWLKRAPLPVDHRAARRARSQVGHRVGYDAQRHAMELFAEGKTDAFLAFPPEPQELRARNFGRIILAPLPTGRGRSTSAAPSSPTGRGFVSTQSPPSARSGPC